jgi:hypothetical protein
MNAVVLVFVLAVVVSAAAHIAILVSVVRRASAVVDASVPRPRLAVEIVWALLPAIVLALVFTATWSKVRERSTRGPDAVLEIAR